MYLSIEASLHELFAKCDGGFKSNEEIGFLDMKSSGLINIRGVLAGLSDETLASLNPKFSICVSNSQREL